MLIKEKRKRKKDEPFNFMNAPAKQESSIHIHISKVQSYQIYSMIFVDNTQQYSYVQVNESYFSLT